MAKVKRYIMKGFGLIILASVLQSYACSGLCSTKLSDCEEELKPKHDCCRKINHNIELQRGDLFNAQMNKICKPAYGGQIVPEESYVKIKIICKLNSINNIKN